MRTLTRLLGLALLLVATAASGAATPSDGRPPVATASAVDHDVAQASQAEAPPHEAPDTQRSLLGLAVAALAFAAFGTIRAGESVEGGTIYRTAFQTTSESVPRRIDPSSFIGSDWVDAFGVLKPGTPLKADGTLAGAADATVAAFVVPFGVGIAAGNTAALLNAAPNGDIAAASRGDLVRSNIEAALGRTLTAFEVTAYNASGRFVIL